MSPELKKIIGIGLTTLLVTPVIGSAYRAEVIPACIETRRNNVPPGKMLVKIREQEALEGKDYGLLWKVRYQLRPDLTGICRTSNRS
jgi:hypothetical protein